MIVHLELSKKQAEALRVYVSASMSALVSDEKKAEEVDLVLFTALKKLRGQLGGKDESVEGTGRSLRSARRLS